MLKVKHPFYFFNGKKYKFISEDWTKGMNAEKLCEICSLRYENEKDENARCCLDDVEWKKKKVSCFNITKGENGFFTEIIPCNKCGKDAVWMGPSNNYCDDCVPRFKCSCNSFPKDGDIENKDEDNWDYEKDEQGRLYPCVDFIKITN